MMTYDDIVIEIGKLSGTCEEKIGLIHKIIEETDGDDISDSALLDIIIEIIGESNEEC